MERHRKKVSQDEGEGRRRRRQKKAKKDAVDDQGKGNDGDKRKKDDGDDKGKKGDGDKRKRKDDDYIAGEELEEQIRAEADRERSQEVPVDTLEYVEDEDEGDAEVNDNDNDAVEEEVDDKNADQEVYDVVGDDEEKREERKSFNFEEEMGTLCKRLESSNAHRAEEAL